MGTRGPAVVALVVLAACSGGGDDDNDEVSPPPTEEPAATTTIALAPSLCAAPAPTQTGTLADPELIELSGLAASRQHDDVLWAHNDSGDRARLFALDHTGVTLAQVTLEGAAAFDWEDMAASDDALYVGDIGDNFSARASVVVYRVDEPEPTMATVPATAYELTYPDGAHDAEALLVDPVSERLLIVTKRPGGDSGVYGTPLAEPGPLELLATLDLGAGQLVTAGDISATGDTIVLRTYGNVFVWEREGDESLADAFAREPCDGPVERETQGEAIALLDDGYVTISEGLNAPLWRVTTTGSAPTSTAGTTDTSSSG